MAWEIDPDFALQSRLSFGRRGVYAWAVVAGALFIGFRGLFWSIGLAFGLAQAGAFLLLAALPYGAIQVRALERGGHMDARRLTGLPPVTLGLALVGGSAWAVLAAAVVLLAGGAAAGHTFPTFTLAALLAMSVAMSLIVLLLPPSSTVDSWVLLVLLFASAVGTVNVMGADHAVALGIIIVSATISPWALPIAVRRMQGAPQQAASQPRSLVGRLVDFHSTSRPEFAKALLSAGTSLNVAAIMALAGTLAIVWTTRRDDPGKRDLFEVLVVYGPLVLAGYDAAARIYHDRLAGALDRVALSGQPAWRVVIESAFAFSLPFVAVSIACAAALAAADRQNAPFILAPWPVTAGILIFWPMVGAFRGRQPGLYVAASVLIAFALARDGAPWALGVLAVVTAIAAATSSLGRGDGMPVDTRLVAAGAASIAAIAAASAAPVWNGLAVAAVLSLSAGLLVPDRSRIPGRAIVAGAAAAAVAAGLAEYVWTYGYFPVPAVIFKALRITSGYPSRATRVFYAGIVALYAAAGFVFGCRVWNRFPDRPLASLPLRAIPLIGGVLLMLALDSHLVLFAIDRFLGDYGYNRIDVFPIVELLALAGLGGTAAVLGWRERAAPIRERTPRS